MIKIENIFIKNVLTLMAGTVIAQLITVSAYPFTTRLYSPADFGLLELFISVFSILSSISCLKYEQAIVIPTDNADALKILKLTLAINAVFSIFILIVIAIFSNNIAIWLGNMSIRYYLFLVPIVVFFSGVFLAVRYFAVRNKAFKLISEANIRKSVVSNLSQVLLGFLKVGPIGLISGPISSSVLFNRKIFLKTNSLVTLKDVFSWKRDKQKYLSLLNEYSDFPRFAVIGTLANSFVLYGTSIFIFKMFSATSLGYLALANRLLAIPLSLISSAIGDVFLQKVAEEKNISGNARVSFKKIFFLLSSIAGLGTIVCYFLLPYIFVAFFGKEWEMAGYYASILIFLFAIRFVNTPLSNIYVVFKRQKLALLGTLIQLLLLLITFSVTYIYNLSFKSYIILFVLSQSCFYIAYLYTAWLIAKRGK